MSFIESPRFPESISYGSTGGPEYKTRISQTGGGQEFRNADWAYPLHAYNVVHGLKTAAQMEQLLALFHAANGRLYGFRFKDFADWKSCAANSAPAFTDQNIGTGDGTTTAFQLRKTYSFGANTLARAIYKPVVGTVVVGINGVQQTTRWAVDTTTGVVTFSANAMKVISAITKGATTQISFATAHAYNVGDSVCISGVVGMTQINGLRAVILSKTTLAIVVAIDSSTFTNYTSGGNTNTIPQPSEAVTAGFEFDVPVRFESDSLPVRFEFYDGHNFQIGLRELRAEG